MIRRLTIGAALAGCLALPVTPQAHEGHTHKVMGTVSSIQASQVDVKTTTGKMVTVVLSDKTSVMRGTEKLDASALKVGLRVAIEATQEKSTLMAQTVKIGTAPPAKP
jgi:hypothetical protein